MYDIENEKIVLEIRQLVRGIDKAKDEVNREVDIYCDLMRQMFLSGSGQN